MGISYVAGAVVSHEGVPVAAIGVSYVGGHRKADADLPPQSACDASGHRRGASDIRHPRASRRPARIRDGGRKRIRDGGRPARLELDVR